MYDPTFQAPYTPEEKICPCCKQVIYEEMTPRELMVVIESIIALAGFSALVILLYIIITFIMRC